MKKYQQLVMAALMFAIQLLLPGQLFAADTSIANLNMSGNVPAIFSVTARGYPGDLDLSGNVAVNDRLLGIVHLKYNVGIASLTIQSTQASGVPSSGATGYSFGTAFSLKFSACTSINATYEAAFDPKPVASGGLGLGAGIDIKDAATTSGAGFTAGIEEDCQLTASWGGNASSLPLAGKYDLAITITMVSL